MSKMATLPAKRVLAVVLAFVTAVVFVAGASVTFAPRAEAQVQSVNQLTPSQVRAAYVPLTQSERERYYQGVKPAPDVPNIMSTGHGPGWCIDSNHKGPSINDRDNYSLHKLTGASGNYGGGAEIHPEISIAAINTVKHLIRDVQNGKVQDAEKKRRVLSALLVNNVDTTNMIRSEGEFVERATGIRSKGYVDRALFTQLTGFEIRRSYGAVNASEPNYYLVRNLDVFREVSKNVSSTEYLTVLLPSDYDPNDTATLQRIVTLYQPGLNLDEKEVAGETVTTTTVTTTVPPRTVTVTPPTETVTLPPKTTTVRETPPEVTTTRTTTVTPPTVTTTQKTTVTATPPVQTKTETVTQPPTTVTGAPVIETKTVTPAPSTVTQPPVTETETVTQPPATVTTTLPAVTETVTPGKVTETVTAPVVTETVKETATETKPGEPTTIRETVPGEPTTIRETVPGEPTTIRETVPGAPTTIRETVPGEPTTIRETVSGEPTTIRETVPGEATTIRETVTETAPSKSCETCKPTTVTETVPGKPGEPTTIRKIETVTVTPEPSEPAPAPNPDPKPGTVPGSLSGTIVWDLDGSKNVSGDDERIENLTVVIKRDGQEVGRTTTDKNGFYKFDGLEPGDYSIEVFGPDGGKLVFEDRQSTVVAGEEDTGNDWGFQRPAPANPFQSVKQTLASTGAETPALLALAGFLAALAGFAAVTRRKLTS